MKRTLILHPFLFAIYAILAPVANNIGDAGLGAIKTLLLGLLLAVLLVAALRLVVKHKEKAALLSTGIILAFFTYGHVESILSRKFSASLLLDACLLAAWGALLALWCYWVLKRLKNFQTLTSYLNAVGLILVIFPIYTIVTYTRQTSAVSSLAADYQQHAWQNSAVTNLAAGSGSQPQPLPDIYYIILDGYTRADVLEELYGYDNSEFIQALEKRGFYVARASRANYTDTVYSIASALNMAHINDAPDFARQNGAVSSEEALKDVISVMVQQNRVRSFLEQQGYTSVSFDSSYDRINVTEADDYEQSPDVSRVNPQAALDLMLLDSTLGKLYFKLRGRNYTPLQSLFDDHRQRVLFTFSNLSKYADKDGAYFVYAHVISPHAPYIFGPNGEPRRSVDPFTLLDTQTGEQWSPELYRDQVIFINKLVIQAIDQILAKSDPKPVIILQADHSSRSYNALDRSDELKMKLLLPILNAYYLPDGAASGLLYPAVTPVNSFRLIFNHYFDTGLAPLEDASYIMENASGRLAFINACQKYRACISK